MGTHALETVVNYWQTGKLTADQVIGQVLQFLQEQQKRLDELEGRLREVEQASERVSECQDLAGLWRTLYPRPVRSRRHPLQRTPPHPHSAWCDGRGAGWQSCWSRSGRY